MESPEVSIIIPVYKQADVLPVALESCLSQTFQSIEIIVVDDGSPDDVAGTVKRFESDIRLLQQENRGLSSARNAGLTEAKGEFVKFLDADDWLVPECLDKQVNVLRGLSHHIAFIGHRLVFEGSFRPNEEIFPRFGRPCYALCYDVLGPIHGMLFRTQDVREIGGFSTESRVQGGHEDYDLTCRMALSGFEAVVVSEIGCVYRQRPGSMSKNTVVNRRTHGQVSRHYFEQLLDRHCNNDLLVHILAGCSERLLTKEFGAESLGVAVDALDRLAHSSDEYSFFCADKLPETLPKLTYSLVSLPGLTREPLWQSYVDSLSHVCERLSDEVGTNRSDHPNAAWIRADMASTLIAAGHSRRGQTVLAKAITSPGLGAVERLGFWLLKLMAYVLPGRSASLVWDRFRACVAGLLGVR